MSDKSTTEQDRSTTYQCCAIARSTGKRCKLPAVKGRNECGMHAGVYRPGQKKGAKPRLKHGLYSAEAYQDRKEARQAIQAVHEVISEIEDVFSKPQLNESMEVQNDNTAGLL